MSGGLYLSYDMETDGVKLTMVRSTYRAFRKLSPKTAVKILRKWIADIEKMSGAYPDAKDEVE